MTKERAKELLPIIEAFAEGKAIQYKKDNVWIDCFYQTDISFERNDVNYRVKPDYECCGNCGCGYS